MAKHTDKKGQKILYHFRQHFGKLDSCIMNDDSSGIVDVFQNYVHIRNELMPFLHENYTNSCQGNTHNLMTLKMFYRGLCHRSDANVTILQSLNAYLKPLANCWYHTS